MKGIENVYLVLAFLVPGLVISYVRLQFVTGRPRSFADSVVPYLAISVLYYGIAFPAVDIVLTVREPGWTKAAAWIGIVFAGPFACGLLLGVLAQRNVLRRLAHRTGLNPVHPLPSAWDYLFSDRTGDVFVMATLGDGDTVAGVFGEHSFASTDPSERDLLIEEIWDVDEAGNWSPRPERVAILIPAKEIRHVQIWR